MRRKHSNARDNGTSFDDNDAKAAQVGCSLPTFFGYCPVMTRTGGAGTFLALCLFFLLFLTLSTP